MTIPSVTDYSQAERAAWLRLSRTKRVGPVTFYRLLERFGSPSEALNAVPKLSTRGGQPPLAPPSFEVIDAERQALARLGGMFLFSCDARYPDVLRHVSDPPPVLSLLGNVDLMNAKQVAIVGARNASANGIRMTTGLATDLGQAGFVITSGMARGIDTAAHNASLATGTVAVVGGGVDITYPPENDDLYHAIRSTGGAVVSEMPLGLKPIAQSFPRRNRIIAGLSYGTVVVEASRRSGSLITARLATEFGREVMAVPGSPLDSRSSGTNHLLREGATLITSADDVVEALRQSIDIAAHEPERSMLPNTPQTFDEKAIDQIADELMTLLSPAPIDIDELIRQTGSQAHIVQAAIVELELSGLIFRDGAKVSRLVS